MEWFNVFKDNNGENEEKKNEESSQSEAKSQGDLPHKENDFYPKNTITYDIIDTSQSEYVTDNVHPSDYR